MTVFVLDSLWADGHLQKTQQFTPNRADTKIRSFANLREGWRYGEGGPVPNGTIALALEWRRFLMLHNINDIDAAPGAGGEIALAATFKGAYTEIIIESDGTFTIIQDQSAAEDIYESGLSMAEAKSLVLNMLGIAWITFGGFILTSSLPSTDVFRAPSSATLGELVPC